MLTGSIGMLPSASLGRDRAPGCSSRSTARRPTSPAQGAANPLAMFLSAALMLRHGLGLEAEAAAIESAVDRALADGLRTRDLGGTASTARGHPGGPHNTYKGAARGTSGPHLAQRRARCLGGREGPRTDARAALRHRRVRGRALLTRPHAGPAIFRHRDHLERLLKSAELYYMPIPYTLEELRAATHELIAANGLRECYIRPIVFRGYGQMGLYPLDCAGRGLDRGVAVGRLPRRGGQAPAASAPRSRAGGGSRTTR